MIFSVYYSQGKRRPGPRPGASHQSHHWPESRGARGAPRALFHIFHLIRPPVPTSAARTHHHHAPCVRAGPAASPCPALSFVPIRDSYVVRVSTSIDSSTITYQSYICIFLKFVLASPSHNQKGRELMNTHIVLSMVHTYMYRT